MAFGDFTVDRNSTKYVLGSGGTIISYATDEPAFEFNADGSYKGLLVEPAATNLATYSEDFRDTAGAGETRPWNYIDITVSADAEESPSGVVDADTLTNGTGGSSELIRNTTISSNTVTLSFFIKPITSARYIFFGDLRTGFANSGIAWFDLQTETVGTEQENGTTTLDSASIVQVVNGFYRISITTTDSTNNTTSSIRIRIVDSDNSTTRVNSAVIAIWGAQVETGPIATSYIPTTTASVTRNKDDITQTGASSLIGQTEGTLYVEVDWRFATGTNQVLLDASDGTGNNRVLIYKDTGGTLYMFVRANSSTLSEQGESSTAYTGIQKIALAYKTDDFELYRNGSSISSDTTGSLAALATLTDIDLGQQYSEVYQANMHIRAVALYPKRLSDAECQALTTL